MKINYYLVSWKGINSSDNKVGQFGYAYKNVSTSEVFEEFLQYLLKSISVINRVDKNEIVITNLTKIGESEE